MESFGFVAPKKIPRSEYLPAKLKPVRDKTPKGKPTLPDDKHLDANKPSRVSRIPLTFTKQAYQCTKGPNADNKGLTNKPVRKPSPKQKKTRVDEKTKTSNIPRRQHDTEKPVKETAVHENQISNDSDLIEGRQNVQRVQHLNIDADFSPKCQSETNSKAKPIPTFGQIYRHNYITDWLLESVSELLDMSDNSIFSGPRIVEITEANDDDETLRNHIIIDSTQNRPSTPSRPEKPIGSNNGPQGAFKTTNQNVSDWLTSEFEHSTKDNESGYRSMSPPSKVQSTTKSKITENLEPAVLVDDTIRSTKSTNDSISSPDGSKGDSKVNSLNGRDTVIVNKLRPECYVSQNVYQAIPKLNTDLKPVQQLKPGTDAVANEQKSAEITASLRLKSRTSVCNKIEAGVSGTSCKSNKSRNKHANIGPSFFTGTNSSIIKKCIARNNHSAISRTNINHGNVKSNVETKDTATDAESVTENEFIHESTSIPSFVNDIQEIGTETDDPSAIVNKVTSATIYSSPNLFETVTHDVPQKIIACNNAGTSIRFTPSTITRSTDNMSCSSVRFKLCGNDTETQVTPAQSVRVVSTGVSAISHTSQHSKPSIITDRTVPCRKIGNKEFSTVLTPKGTILSCTGTKITSVSSTSIENPYILPKQSAVVSTSVTVNNVDCLTAKSLHYRGCKDVCLDTRATNKLYDEKASCTSGLGPHLHTAVSAMDLVEQVSFNGGSHHTKRSVVAEFHPEYNAASTNTITELTSKSVGRDSSGSVARSIDNESRVDAFVQYSGFQDHYDSTNQGQQSACIGRSQLMSMRMLCDSATEAATQAQFEYLNAETKTTPRKHMSTSTVTSQYFLGDPVPANMMTHKEDPAPMLLCGCTQVGSPIEPPTQLKEMNNSYEKLPPSASNSKPINAYDGQTNLRTQIVTTKSQSCTASNNYEPNTVISSNLNAAKWMKGYPNIVEKDFQSIVDISRSTVSESLERASLVLENSKIRCEETKRLAHEKQSSNHPAVNCVTPLPAVSNESVLDVLPAKEHLTEPTDSSQDCKMVDEITSDKIVPKEMKETVIQASPTVRDSGLDSTYLPKTEQKSASVLTSRYILADPKPCCLSRNINFGSSEACQECLFVYDQPRCIVHKHQEDAAIQRQPSGRDFEMNSVKQEVSRRSACLAACVTSSHARVVSQQLVGQILPREMDSVKEEQSNQRQEALSLAENVSHHSERDSNALIAEVHTSEEKASLKEVTYSTGVLTSQMVTGDAMQQCQRRSSDLSGGVLTPQAYKALYETTKSLIKDKSKSQTPIHSPVRGSITEKGTEKSVTQNQQNTCLHCCCNLNQDKKDSCSRSTQAVFEVMQMCPHCCFETLHEPIAENIDTVEEYVKSYLMTSCRYYTNMLTKQLDRVKENLKKHLTPPGESVCKAPSISKLLIEACTMKPSGRQDDCCQTIKVRSTLNIFSNPPSLMNALSATDFRENQDKQDLKTMYYMLSSIEGRVRRLKNNLIT
ncbi:uncharacterized protein [Epargyreus clarus]|uniref:uncharacterized protein isoform X2 n=1 Tax=Epargyreus clarus TaxID=520877 RepID=UPI003C2FF1E1